MAEYGADKPPVEDDLRFDDQEYNPAIEPQSAGVAELVAGGRV
jgi:hypothetical protein